MTANGYRVLFRVMKMFWNLTVVIVAQSVNLQYYKLLNSTLKRVDFMIHKLNLSVKTDKVKRGDSQQGSHCYGRLPRCGSLFEWRGSHKDSELQRM